MLSEFIHDKAATAIRGEIGFLAARTLGDVEKVMIGHPTSGLLVTQRPENPCEFKRLPGRSTPCLVWANGAYAETHSSEDPERARGPQYAWGGADEIGTWKRVVDFKGNTTWTNLQMGLRGGSHPQMIAVTTPRPIQMLRDLVADAAAPDGDTYLTTGTLHDNAANLPESFLRFIKKEYEGTRLERQEISGELLSDTEGAILSLEMLDALRVSEAPDMARIVVGVDPAGKSKNTSDLTGINISGRGVDGHLYSLANRSCRLSPNGWGRRVVEAYNEFEADLIVAEDNMGGEMIETVIRGVDGGRYVNVKSRTATKSKSKRAEPVLAFYERKEAHIVGDQKSLEDQLVQFTPEGYDGDSSPDDADAHVWAATELMLGAQSTWEDMIQANAG